MQKYTLMHKNAPCAVVAIDEKTGKILKYKTTDRRHVPYFGACDTDKFRKWWKMRAVPASRESIRRFSRVPEEYLAKNLALSMTDTYWLRPEASGLSWDCVNLRNYTGYSGKIPYHNATSYDPNASLGGQMDKYWDISTNPPQLVKESYRSYGQQALNEVFATLIHTRQGTSVPFVRYTAERTEDGGYRCRCAAFTSDSAEFVSAYEVLESEKKLGSENNLQAYIRITEKHGADREEMQDFLDYQALTDFIISNTDEHLQNFGALRDTETGQILGPAPIFDSGNSMFYDDDRTVPYTRSEILSKKITGVFDTEEKMLRNVRRPEIVRLDLLPSPEEVKEFFAEAGVPEEKAEFISKNYATKIELTEGLQRGTVISLYRERQRERAEKAGKNTEVPVQRLVVIAGAPGSGKQNAVEEVLKEMKEKGYSLQNDSELYPAEQADTDAEWVLDEKKILGKQMREQGNARSVVLVSPNRIREERRNASLPEREDLVFLIAHARVRQALINGESVVYSATNIKRRERLHILSLAEGCEARKELKVVLGRQKSRAEEALEESWPFASEGWDEVSKEQKCEDRVDVGVAER